MKNSKQRLFEVMNKISGMPLNEHNYSHDLLNDPDHIDWKKVYSVLDNNTEFLRNSEIPYNGYISPISITDVISIELLNKLILGTESIKNWGVDDDDIYTSFQNTSPEFGEFMNVVKQIFA